MTGRSDLIVEEGQMTQNGGDKSFVLVKGIFYAIGIILMGMGSWMAMIQASVKEHAAKISSLETKVAVQDAKLDEIIRRLYFIEMKLDPAGFVPKPKWKAEDTK